MWAATKNTKRAPLSAITIFMATVVCTEARPGEVRVSVAMRENLPPRADTLFRRPARAAAGPGAGRAPALM